MVDFFVFKMRRTTNELLAANEIMRNLKNDVSCTLHKLSKH